MLSLGGSTLVPVRSDNSTSPTNRAQVDGSTWALSWIRGSAPDRIGPIRLVPVEMRKGLGSRVAHSNDPGKDRCLMVTRSRVPLGTTARTGEKCPESGIWAVVGTPSTTAPIAAGNRMPPYGGRAVTWRLTQYA